MNRLFIIGNLVRDPETKEVRGGTVCNFTVAVNRKKTQNNPDPGADFFRVAAWNKLGETCQKYLTKGRKVAVVGTVSARAYTNSNGEAAASLEVMAQDVEFLSANGQGESASATPTPAPAGYTAVETGELPF